MGWVKLERVACYGFPSSILPYLVAAIDAGDAQWDEDRRLYGWIGCQWHLITISVYIVGVELVSGHIDSQDLTAAKLKYTIETS